MSESTIGQGKTNDLISRQNVLNIIDWVHYNHCFSPSEERIFNYLKEVIAECEASTIDPVKHGKWIPVNERAAKCSLCGEWEYTNGRDKTGTAIIHKAIKHYCPNCGARMT